MSQRRQNGFESAMSKCFDMAAQAWKGEHDPETVTRLEQLSEDLDALEGDFYASDTSIQELETRLKTVRTGFTQILEVCHARA